MHGFRSLQKASQNTSWAYEFEIESFTEPHSNEKEEKKNILWIDVDEGLCILLLYSWIYGGRKMGMAPPTTL